MVAWPRALATASAATVTPLSRTTEAEPRPPLRLAVVAPVPAPTEPRAKSIGRRRVGGAAEMAVGRLGAPVLVAAVEEIEEDRRRHDRHAHIADRQAAPVRDQPGDDTGRGIEPEGRAAGEDDRVDPLDRLLGREQVGLARPGRAAHHVDRGDRRLIADDDGHARLDPRIVGIADAEAGDVGEEVAGAGLHAASLADSWGERDDATSAQGSCRLRGNGGGAGK